MRGKLTQVKELVQLLAKVGGYVTHIPPPRLSGLISRWLVRFGRLGAQNLQKMQPDNLVLTDFISIRDNSRQSVIYQRKGRFP